MYKAMNFLIDSGNAGCVVCCFSAMILIFVIFLQGTVIVIANHGDRIDIPSGALLENKIVSGNLRILQH